MKTETSDAHNQDLQNLEQPTCRGSYADGIIDVYIGISLFWIGVAWIWLPDIAGLAGVLPAIFIAPMLGGRSRFLEKRIGYLKRKEPRRQWEQRDLGGPHRMDSPAAPRLGFLHVRQRLLCGP